MMRNYQELLAGFGGAQWQPNKGIRWRLREEAPAHPVALHRHPHHAQTPAKVRRASPPDFSGEIRPPLFSGDILPRRHFLSQLQREKRRTERTAAPLSMALFRFENENRDQSNTIGELLELLRSTKRETDIVGSLGADSVAVLLPDTDQQGAQVLADRIATRAGNPAVSTLAVTYPDQLFESLVAEKHETQESAPLFPEEVVDHREPGYLLKRGLDIALSLFALLVLSPLMLVTAIAVAATSRGPVIFRQVRVGKKGVPFVFYKFRSMRSDADDRIHREYVDKLINGNHDEINQGSTDQPFYKLKADPRVTPIGKFIRHTHIDELPQLVNVLKGDMSLVGPRPALPYEVEKYEFWHFRRILEIKPGITGLWQVNGHNTTTFDEMVRLDLRYIRNCSLLLDLGILLKTVKVILDRLRG